MIKQQKDFFAGLLFIAFGVAGYTIGQEYPFGTTTRMGPGYFPTVLSGLLMLIGLVCSVRALFGQVERMDAIFVRKTLAIIVPVLIFAAIVKGAGLVLATVVVVVGSALASERFHLPSAVALAIGMAAFCWAVFTLGLGLPLPAFGPWLINP